MANRRTRRKNITLFVIVIALVGGAALTHHLRIGQWRVVTENAQVAGNITRVAALTDGTVSELLVEQGDYVEAGAVLLRLADQDARASYQQALAALSLASKELAALAVRAEVQRAEQQRHTERLANHRRDHQRKIQLAAQGLLAEESLTSSQSELTQQQAALRVAEQQLVEIERRLGSAPLRQHPQLQLASAELRHAAYRLNKHSVRAPTAGYITKRYINLGQLVEAGTPLLSLVDPSERWLEANFKEDQLRNLRLGQPVTIESELYGSEHTFKGVVAAAGFATGAEFALLPPQNATGNWVKILQRVPVRIEFTEGLQSDTPLPIGASLTVTVDTHQRDGAALTDPTGQRQPRRAAAQQRDYSGDVEAVIAATIASHLAP